MYCAHATQSLNKICLVLYSSQIQCVMLNVCGFFSLLFSTSFIYSFWLFLLLLILFHFIHVAALCNSMAAGREARMRQPQSKYMSIWFYESKCTILVLITRYMHLNNWTGLIKAWTTVFNFIDDTCVCSTIRSSSHCEPFNRFLYLILPVKRNETEGSDKIWRQSSSVSYNLSI